ncbi:MAG: hypothetical protein NTX15_10795 [Candidatus Kapabacteria bacterium]|nr:hypothetical protein [Candidatus Kapabacteria bacterium]
MRIRHVFLLSIALMAVLVPNVFAQAESFTWKQQTVSNGVGSGPVVAKVAQRVRYDADTAALTVWGIVDSTDASNFLFMKLVLKKFVGVKGLFVLDDITVYQYGARADMKYKCTGGTSNITSVDDATNTVTGTFSWYGYVKLQNGIELNVHISEGAFTLKIRPELGIVARPADGAKVKPKKPHTVTIFAIKQINPKVFIEGATITLTHDATAFKNAKTLTAVTNAEGAATFVLDTRAELVGGDYTFKVKATKKDFIDSKETTVKFKVDTTDRYYYSKCKGAQFIEFDAGVGEKWEDDGAPYVMSTGEKVLMAGLITFPGKVRIDTSLGGAKVFFNTSAKIEQTFFDGTEKDFVIVNSPMTFVAPKCDLVLDFALKELSEQLTGGKIINPRIEMLGNGVSAAGLKIGAGMELGTNTYDGCNSDLPFGTVWAPNKKAEVDLEVGFLKTGPRWDLLATGTVKNFTPVASWCVKEAKVEYRGDSSLFRLSAKIKNSMFSDASGSVTFKDGTLNALKIDFELERCIPIPDLPNVCWRGGGFSVENLLIGNPLRGSVNAKFGPYDPLKDLYLLTIEGGFEDPPAKVYGKITGNLVKMEALSSKKPWQIEVSGKGTVEPAAVKATLDVSASALHLGADYFLTGTLSASLALNPIGVSGAFSGSMKFPKVADELLPKAGKIGRFINQWAPFPLGTVSGTISLLASGERTATVKYDMTNLISPGPAADEVTAALRAMGRGTLSVDFNLLPSPSAWDLDAGFIELFKAGLFGSVENGKAGDRTQAADKMVAVPAGQESIVIFLETAAAGVASSLKTPTGATLTATDVANGIFRVPSPDGKITLWVVKNPQVGNWTISAPTASATDTLSVMGVVPPPTFELSSSIVGNDLKATWTGTSLPSDCRVQIFVDNDDKGFDGTYVGTATAGVGSLTVALQDSTIPCSFHVYAIVSGKTVGIADYSSDTHANPRATLPIPMNAVAESNLAGNTTITWTPINDARVASIGVLDASTDSLVTSAYRFENSVSATVPSHQTTQLRLVTYDHNGRRSCESAPISITTDVDDDVVFAGDHGYTIGVAPHPVTDRARIFINGVVAETVNVHVVDIRGVDVYSSVVVLDRANAILVEVPSSALTSGVYTIILSTPSALVSRSFIVMH